MAEKTYVQNYGLDYKWVIIKKLQMMEIEKAICFGEGPAFNLNIKLVSQEHLEFYDSLCYIGDPT